MRLDILFAVSKVSFPWHFLPIREGIIGVRFEVWGNVGGSRNLKFGT